MLDCLTRPLSSKYSGCLVEKPSCNFAVRFGFSFLCEHPQHKYFIQSMPISGHHTDHVVDHNELYRNLKESRRRKYISEARKIIEDLERGII